jgi:hypothetical protein
MKKWNKKLNEELFLSNPKKVLFSETVNNLPFFVFRDEKLTVYI